MADEPSANSGLGAANDERLRAAERGLRAADERFRYRFLVPECASST